jgi:hypothetical protein
VRGTPLAERLLNTIRPRTPRSLPRGDGTVSWAFRGFAPAAGRIPASFVRSALHASYASYKEASTAMNQPLQRLDANPRVIDSPRERDRLSLWLTAIVVMLLATVLYVFWTNFSASLDAATGLLKQLLAFCVGIAIPASVSVGAHRAYRRILRARLARNGPHGQASG